MFLAGIGFILLEIFVIPGFGIFGLGGGAMVVASLVLASQTFILPHSKSQMIELRNSLAVVAVACVGVIAVAFSARKYLPKTPFFSRMILQPPQDEQREALEEHEMLADYSHLIGQTGTTKTDLMPTGKALVDHELIDVIAESVGNRTQHADCRRLGPCQPRGGPGSRVRSSRRGVGGAEGENIEYRTRNYEV